MQSALDAFKVAFHVLHKAGMLFWEGMHHAGIIALIPLWALS